MSSRLVIVGAGMATAYLLQELGREAADMEIIVLGEEADTCYNRVLLSNVLAGDTAETELQMLEPGALPASVTFLSGTRAVSVDRINRLVESDCGRLISYDRLVFATGASVARPPLAQTDVCGVEQFRTLTDARKLRSLMREGARAVVVGGGLLGLEAAHGLITLGFATTVVHRQTCLMNRQLDAEGAAQLQKDLESRGVRFRTAAVRHRYQSEYGHCKRRRPYGGPGHCDRSLYADIRREGVCPRRMFPAGRGLFWTGRAYPGAGESAGPGVARNRDRGV